MTKFKIVKHFFDNSGNYLYRVYRRQYLFFWEHVDSYNTVYECEDFISLVKIESDKSAIPKDVVIGYYD